VTTTLAGRRERITALSYDYATKPREAVDVCNLCGEARFVVVTHRDRYGYDAQAHACSRCGLVFLNPRMTPAAYARFYDGIYRPLVSAFHGRLIDAQTIQAEQHEYAVERARLLRPFVHKSRGATLLDIGGSTGVVAHHFAREFGLDATVIDPAPLEIEQARRLGVDTIAGLVEQHDFGDRRFDAVIICQTVDHLLDVSGTLRRVRQLLAADGLLLVDIVDFRAAYLRNWNVEDAVKIDHPYYLTEPTMDAYLRRAGFDVRRVEYAADHLHVSYVCTPTEPRAVLPAVEEVAALLKEIRFVQNTTRPA
jgi:2-polyprenyl-3-methyl-5-hydroxy-6-metoxy-1,4-benzoquinol methylase